MHEKMPEGMKNAIVLGEDEVVATNGNLVCKMRKISLGDKMYLGYLKYSELKKSDIEQFKHENGEDYIDILVETFDAVKKEVGAVLEVIEKQNKSYVYLQTIDIGFNRGMGIGQAALELFEKSFSEKEVILYAYPLADRIANGFDSAYMKKCEKKLHKFYKRCGYENVCGRIFVKTL